MYKVLRDGSIRSKAANYLKNVRKEIRLQSTKSEVVSSADVVIIGQYF